MENGGTLEIPMRMAESMADNPEAMEAFCRLDGERRAELISKARNVHSREEMTALVRGLTQVGH